MHLPNRALMSSAVMSISVFPVKVIPELVRIEADK